MNRLNLVANPNGLPDGRICEVKDGTETISLAGFVSCP